MEVTPLESKQQRPAMAEDCSYEPPTDERIVMTGPTETLEDTAPPLAGVVRRVLQVARDHQQSDPEAEALKDKATRLVSVVEQLTGDIEAKQAELAATGRRLAQRALQVALGHQQPDPEADRFDQLAAAALRESIGPLQLALPEAQQLAEAARDEVQQFAVAAAIKKYREADADLVAAREAFFPTIEGLTSGMAALLVALAARKLAEGRLGDLQEQGHMTAALLHDVTARKSKMRSHTAGAPDREEWERNIKDPAYVAALDRERLDEALDRFARGADVPAWMLRYHEWKAAARAAEGQPAPAEPEVDEAGNQRLIDDAAAWLGR